jgi:hypothetical protein
MPRTHAARVPLVGWIVAVVVLLAAACGPSRLEQDLTAENQRLAAQVADLNATVVQLREESETAGTTLSEALAAVEAAQQTRAEVEDERDAALAARDEAVAARDEAAAGARSIEAATASERDEAVCPGGGGGRGPCRA